MLAFNYSWKCFGNYGLAKENVKTKGAVIVLLLQTLDLEGG
jgi:hypothetical protein